MTTKTQLTAVECTFDIESDGEEHVVVVKQVYGEGDTGVCEVFPTREDAERFIAEQVSILGQNRVWVDFDVSEDEAWTLLEQGLDERDELRERVKELEARVQELEQR